MKKIINNMASMLVCIVIIMASVIVGSPLKENTQIISIITLTIFLIYILLYKTVLKNKYKTIIQNINKLDIGVLILCLCPFIPIIFNTSINLADSINIGIRYITVLLLYMMSKILIIQDKRYANHMMTTIIITGIISAIIGIDNMTFKFFLNLLYKIGVPFVVNIENRMFGNFGYANTFAMSLLVPLILSLDRYIKKENKNIIYVGINFIFMACIILSYSKAVYLVTVLSIIIYIFLQKDKKKMVKIISNMIILMIGAIIYSKIFTNFYQEKNNIGIWIMTLEFMLISAVMILFVNKLIEKSKFRIKKYISFFILFIILMILFITLGLNLKKALTIFENKTQTSEVKYKIPHVIPNQKYQFIFDIEARSLYNKKIYSIQVIEEDKYYKTIKEHEIKIDTFLGQKNIEFESDSNTVEFALIFKSNNPEEQKGLKINSLKINGEEYILNYLYLPASVVNKIKTLDISNLSIRERLTFYKDAMKLIKRNPWTGIGGNGWNYKYPEIKSYDYESTQVHSYPLQIFLEFGLTAIIVYIMICIFLLKHNKTENIGVLTAIFAILLHSMVDFDLSFMNMLLYTFLLISIISSEEERKAK